jgi:filamentous hemagglutinin
VLGDETVLGKVVNGTNFAPCAFSYSGTEIEQATRATVGPGTIIVRDNPGMDLSGLNRDISKALTEETIRNTNFTLDPLFGRVDAAPMRRQRLMRGMEGTGRGERTC